MAIVVAPLDLVNLFVDKREPNHKRDIFWGDDGINEEMNVGYL
jgi:hypothetical protein